MYCMPRKDLSNFFQIPFGDKIEKIRKPDVWASSRSWKRNAMKLPQMGQEMVGAGRERRICILAYWPAGVSYPGASYPGERYTRRQIHQGCLLKRPSSSMLLLSVYGGPPSAGPSRARICFVHCWASAPNKTVPDTELALRLSGSRCELHEQMSKPIKGLVCRDPCKSKRHFYFFCG